MKPMKPESIDLAVARLERQLPGMIDRAMAERVHSRDVREQQIIRMAVNIVRRQLAESVALSLTWRGTYERGETYRRGDVVRYGTAAWVALVETSEAPAAPEWDYLVSAVGGGGGISSGGGTTPLDSLVHIGPNPPAVQTPGKLWWRTDPDGDLYIRYGDGASTQWVRAAAPYNSGAAADVLIHIGPTPPAIALPGTLWWRTDPDGALYILYDDGTTTQWVAATPLGA